MSPEHRRVRTRPRRLHHEPAAVGWAREKAGLTRRGLAARVGISEQLMGEIESGWRNATPANLAKIAAALNCPLVLLERRRPDDPADVRAREAPQSPEHGGEMTTTSADPQDPHRTPPPWGMARMVPLRNGEPSPWRYAGLDPRTQTGRWRGPDGRLAPAELGKHGTSVNTYPPTQVSKDGKQDPDSGHDAAQD